MDYLEPITATAAQHIENIKESLEYLFKNNNVDIIIENLDILEECKRVIKILKTKPKRVLYTIQFYDGLDYFEIKEGM